MTDSTDDAEVAVYNKDALRLWEKMDAKEKRRNVVARKLPDTTPDDPGAYFENQAPSAATGAAPTLEDAKAKGVRMMSWLSQLEEDVGQRVAIYGTGGIGKSSLAALAPDPILYVDVENRMILLKDKIKRKIALVRPATWEELLNAIADCREYAEIKTVVIDSLTRAEILCTAHVLKNVQTEKGASVSSIEGYGFGKGLIHLYEEFSKIFRPLDYHIALGRNVVLIAHQYPAKVPNPAGEDWRQWSPRLQNPDSGKASICCLVKEWVDHLLFLSYDVTVEKGGKAKGCGSRAIWPQETPWHLAKSISLLQPIGFAEGEDTLWQLLKKGDKA